MLQLMDQLGLNYGAADLILTPENEDVFLEVNPVGEFFWLDKLSGGDIASAIADLLVGKGKRRVVKKRYKPLRSLVFFLSHLLHSELQRKMLRFFCVSRIIAL